MFLNFSNKELVIDLKDKLQPRELSYYCADELSECIDDCKKAGGDHLRNTVLSDPSVSILNEEIFSDFLTARRACMLYGKKTDTSRVEGINVFLKYSTRESVNVRYPLGQELILGNICCDDYWPYNVQLMPFNKCKPFGYNQIPENFENKD